MATLTRPRLKQGETLQSASFVKRMRTFNRSVALAEATKAKTKQDAREARQRSSRNVLTEVSKTRKKPAAPANTADKKQTPARQARVAGSARAALEGRAATIEEAVEGGINAANEANKPKR